MLNPVHGSASYCITSRIGPLMKTNAKSSGREGVRVALSGWSWVVSVCMHVKGRGEVGLLSLQHTPFLCVIS